MKASETKSTHSQQHGAADKSSASQEQERAFFSEPTFEQTPFFQPTAVPGLQTKPITQDKPFFQPASVPTIQAKCASCETEEKKEQEEPVPERPMVQRMPGFESAEEPPPEEPDEKGLTVQRMPAFESAREAKDTEKPTIQFKLTIGQPNDPYEQEADRVAEQVMSIAPPATPNIQRQMETEESEDIQPKPLVKKITPIIQRQEASADEELIQAKCEACEAEKQVQRSSNEVVQVQPDFESRLNASKGGGNPLPDEVRSFMEPRFEADFRQVRVHTGGDGVQMNRELGAQAFTHRNHIYYGAGKAPAKDKLTGHELTHVVQQTAIQTLEKPLQRDPDPAAPAPPAPTPTSPIHPAPTGLSVSMDGLSFLPSGRATFRTGAKALQACEILLYRLVSNQYTVELPNELYPRLTAAGWGGLGTLAGDATEGEQITLFMVPLRESLQIIAWLENVKHLQVGLTDKQRELLSLGIAAFSAWHDMNLPDVAREINIPFPQWYNETLFQQQISSNVRLLRQYIDAAVAYRADRNSANRQLVIQALTDIASEFENASAVLEAIRADSALIGHEVYQLLWPSPQAEGNAPPLPPVMASSSRAPEPTIASSFLAFVQTQSSLAIQAFTHTDARQELMTRFGRFLGRTLASTTEGDQQITETPATANTPPLESRLYVSPPLSGPPGAPQFEASAAADYRFITGIMFPDVFTAFTSYYFEWNYVRVPDEQIGRPTNVDNLPTHDPSFGDVAARRFRRAGQYAVEDVQTLFSTLGPAGINATSLVAANAILRFIGTGIRLGFELITMPQSETSIAFPEPGVYLVRSKAIPQQADGAELVRPPSVAFQPVIVRNPTEIVEDRVRQDAAISNRDFARMQELRELLAQPVSHANEAELRQELSRLERGLSSVGGSFEVQREQLVEYLNSLPPGGDARRQVQQQLEQLDALIALRRSRGKDHNLTSAEPLNASFISDDGRSMRLTMEAVRQSGTDHAQTYWVSDLTTANSSQDTGTGPDRPTAIMNAVEAILRGYAGYGRGHVSVHIDGQPYTRRIAASLGSLLNEALENVTTALSLALVVAAPFTGGASLALLLPVGAVGALPSAYRLINRGIDDTLRLDMATAMDVVNLLGGFAGLGHAAVPIRMVNVGRAFMVMGLGLDGLGMLMIPVGIASQIAELEGLSAGERAARIMEILGQAMLNVGIMVGGALAQRARQQNMETHGRTGAPGGDLSGQHRDPSSQHGDSPNQHSDTDPAASGRSGAHTSEPLGRDTSSGVVIEGSALHGDGRLKYTKSGRLVRCTNPCADLEILYAREMGENPALRERLERLKSNFENADPTDFRTLQRLFAEEQLLDGDLQAAYSHRTLTLGPARAEFPAKQAELSQIETKLATAGRPELAEVVNDIAHLQRDGRIAGFEDWIDSTAPRNADDVVNVTAELLEARRIARDIATDQPNAVIRIGQDSITRGKSFDISVESPDGSGTLTPQRRIEVQRVGDVQSAYDLLDGIRHGAEKIPPSVVSGAARPTEAMESTVQVNWPPSPRDTGSDGIIHYDIDGSYTIPNRRNPGYTGNFIRDLLAGSNNLNRGVVDPRIKLLSAINIIDQNGNLVGRLQNRTPGTTSWTIDFIRPR